MNSIAASARPACVNSVFPSQSSGASAWGQPVALPTDLRARTGRNRQSGSRRRRANGFTLLELMVVVSIIALASAGVGFAMRDSSQTQLDREADRLAALLETARARSRASGVPVRWRPTPQGFVFEGLPSGTLPQAWLSPGTAAVGGTPVLLGPEPLIGPQQVVLTVLARPERSLRVATDGLRPFAVTTVGAP